VRHRPRANRYDKHQGGAGFRAMSEAYAASNLLRLERAKDAASPLTIEVTGLFEQFRIPLFRYLLSLGLQAHDAEEVIQEVFLALFQHLKSDKSRANLRGWIFRVGHNQAMRVSRVPAFADADLQNTQVDPEPDPEQMALRNQRQRRLTAVVRALSEQDRACLSLRAEGLRYREIAEILGISLGSVAQSLTRSLDKLGRAHEL